MKKSPEAFRTISEVAEWLGTPAHVLRFWESRFSQVKPVKRAGGRRYYRPTDMALLGGIRRLLHDDGITIKGVQKILKEKGVKHVAGMAVEQLQSTGDASDFEQADQTTAAPKSPDAAPRPVFGYVGTAPSFDERANEIKESRSDSEAEATVAAPPADSSESAPVAPPPKRSGVGLAYGGPREKRIHVLYGKLRDLRAKIAEDMDVG